MKISSLTRYAVVVTAAAGLLAACSSNGGSSLAPTGNTTAGMNGSHVMGALKVNGIFITAAHPALSHGAFTPDRHKHHKKKPDQYITDFSASEAFEFNYPKSDSSIGTITNISNAQGQCTKNGKGTFWITATGTSQIDEFKVGATSPMATLSVAAEGQPAGCAVDPASGDVAATIISNGDVVVFAGGAGSGTTYSSGLAEAFFGTYDKSGNLFVDGFNDSFIPAVVMLPKGSSTFKAVSLPNSIEFPGNIQWDGTYVTVNDQEAFSVYQYSVSGTTATLKGTVAYSGASDCDQTWIAKGRLLCPDAGAINFKVYNYPAGGAPVATLTAAFSEPIGAVQVAK